MQYRRKESFRYTFDMPISAHFKIIELNSNAVETHEGEANIMDISPHGLKLSSTLHIPSGSKLLIRFSLNEKKWLVHGEIMWKKVLGKNFFYGIDLTISEEKKNLLIQQLKLFSRKQKGL